MQNILIVVDMQNDFIDGALGTKEAAAIVPKVEEKIRDFDGKVFFTTDGKRPMLGSFVNVKITDCMDCDLTGELIREELDALRKTEPIDKETFGSTDLAGELVALNEDEEIGSITLVGLCTDICVISNALLIKASLPEVPICVDATCCAGVTPESHENALKAMEACQIRIIR